MSNPVILRNYLVIACRHSALLGLLSALGSLGRRLEMCRPDSNNPSHRQVSQPVFFIASNKTYSHLCHIYVI